MTYDVPVKQLSCHLLLISLLLLERQQRVRRLGRTAVLWRTQAASRQQRTRTGKAAFAFTQTAPDRLVLDGTIDGRKATLQLRRLDPAKFQLNSRGFHWIQDYPFNR